MIVPLNTLDGFWHCVHVRSKAERMAAFLLKEKGYEVFLPTQRGKGPKRTRIEEPPLFPGYVFCRPGEHVSGLIVTTPGVIRLLCCAGRPQRVPDADIENLQRIVASGLPVKPSAKFQRGTPVRVVSGPLKGCAGFVERTKGDTCLMVSLEILRRSVIVRIERDWVQRESAVGGTMAYAHQIA